MPHKRLIQGVCVRITARISNFVQCRVGFGKHVFGGFYPFIYKEFFIETPFACLNFSNKAVRLYPKDLHNESILTSLEILSSIYLEISLTSFSSFFFGALLFVRSKENRKDFIKRRKNYELRFCRAVAGVVQFVDTGQ